MELLDNSNHELLSILSSNIPQIDQYLQDYIISVLNDESIDEVSDIYDAIGDMLLSCFENDDAYDQVMNICQQLYNTINNIKGENGVNDKNSFKTLETPIDLGAMASEFESSSTEWKSIWTAKKELSTKIDSKKLEKAEAKLKIKAEKRQTNDNDNKDKSFNHICKEANVNQMISKKDTKQETRGTNRSKDIKIENFDLMFGDQVLLKSAEMTLSYGRRYGLCGRNGIGKSTLLRMIANGSLMIPSHISILHVEQEVIGDDKTALMSVLECDTIRNELIEEEKLLSSSKNLTQEQSTRLNEIYKELMAIEADKAEAKASIILSGLGFTTTMQKQATKEFSGGWRMRIALARALFSKPDLLLLDEPTNMLDMKAIIWLEKYLINEWKSTLLVVSHDRKFLSIVPNEILHFHSKRIDSYKGDYEDFVKTMTEKLKNQQREYEAQQQYRKHAQEFIDKFRYNAKRASLVQSRIKALEKLPELQPVEKEPDVVLRFPEPEHLSPPVLQLDEASFSYVNTKTVLNKINLNANMESRICIVGDNGSGKTTLLKLLTGELSPTKGIRHAHRNLSIGYFSQHHVDQLTMNQSPIEFLSTKFPGKPSEQYRRHLGGFGITGDLSLQSVSSLSGGQKSRVSFATISLLNPHILILDEPTNHLDVETVEALGKALEKFKGGVILVTHDELLIKMVCKELWYCCNGGVKCLEGGFNEYRQIIESELADIK